MAGPFADLGNSAPRRSKFQTFTVPRLLVRTFRSSRVPSIALSPREPRHDFAGFLRRFRRPEFVFQPRDSRSSKQTHPICDFAEQWWRLGQAGSLRKSAFGMDYIAANVRLPQPPPWSPTGHVGISLKRPRDNGRSHSAVPDLRANGPCLQLHTGRYRQAFLVIFL